MKSPAEYVEAARAARPVRPGPVISVLDAELAVATAQADAERYRQMLVGAALRAKSSPQTADSATSPNG